MTAFSTDAVLLRKIEYGDHDLIITFLAREHGKIAAIAKNAKQSVKRFPGALDLFALSQIQCRYPKKRPDSLLVLTQAGLENGFANIRYDVFKTAYASYWTEMLTLWLEEGRPQDALYDLLCYCLSLLDRSRVRPEVISLLFQIRFMTLSGFGPGLDCCGNCSALVDKLAQSRVRFDFKEGKILCPSCIRSGSGYGMTIAKGTLKELAWINATGTNRAERLRPAPGAIREGEALLESFIPFHIGRAFKSLAFLRRLRQDL